MAVFTIEAPDGRQIDIEAADEATAVRGAQEWAAANPAAKKIVGRPGKMDPAQGGVSENVQFAPGQEPRPSLADEAMSLGRGMIEGIPIAGPMLADARRGLDANIGALFQGRPAAELQADYKAKDDALAAKTGGARAIGNVAGSVAALAPLGMTAAGGKLLGMTGSLPSRMGFGAASGATITGADTLARGGTIEEAGRNALLGGGLGAVVPAIGAGINKVGQGMAQRSATNAAIKGAPAASDLKTAASSMFQQLDQNGVQVSGQRFGNMAIDLVRKFQKMRANPNLDPKAVAALQELVKAADDVQRSGGGIVLSDLHTLRQIAQKSAQSAEGRDKMFSTQIISAIDDMITGLKPADIVGGADPKQASKLMFDAIGTWGRARRVGLIEEAIYRAQNVASGAENGLRIEFRKLLQNPDTRKAFSKAELQAIEDVVRGNPVANLTKLLGKFGFGTNGAGNMLGGTIGFGAGSVFGGPLAGILAAGVGTGARKASEVLTTKAAERAARVVATPNVPSLPMRALPALPVAPVVLPLTVMGQ
jgi:hypothetical protein